MELKTHMLPYSPTTHRIAKRLTISDAQIVLDLKMLMPKMSVVIGNFQQKNNHFLCDQS